MGLLESAHDRGPGIVTRPVKRIVGGVAMGRQMRVDIYFTTADLLTSGLAPENALGIVSASLRRGSSGIAARILKQWSAAAGRGTLSQEIATWVPASEAMIFAAWGRIDAAPIFAAAGRVTEMHDRQIKAIVARLRVPALLLVISIVTLWFAGGSAIPELMDLVDEEKWGPLALVVRAASLWLYAYPYIFGLAVAAVVAFLWVLILNWTGPGRALADAAPPFSLYRVVAGSAFMFVLLEYLRAGLDLNDKSFEEMKRCASRYTRHRIGAIQALMQRGMGLGASMIEADHGFPDPKLSWIVDSLEDFTRGEELKLHAHAHRWALRSDALIREHTFALGVALYVPAMVTILAALHTAFTLAELSVTSAIADLMRLYLGQLLDDPMPSPPPAWPGGL